jgi:hypothetical protein
MDLKTIQTLKDNLFKVRFETTPSPAETELVSDFGEPTISMGGNFYGCNATFASTPSVGANLTQGAAAGVYIYDGIIRSGASLFTVGAAGAYTITSAADLSYTLSASIKRLFSDSPLSAMLNYEDQARIFVSTEEDRITTAIEALRANEDNFSAEYVRTI